MNDERRTHYRVDTGLSEIRVGIAWPGYGYADAKLIDLSATGAAISIALPSSRIPDHSDSDLVQVRFVLPGGKEIADLQARVRHEHDADGERAIGLEIEDWRRLHDELPPRFFKQFNRRQDFRVDVPQDPPVIVDVDRRQARLCDISAGGCSLTFDLPAPELDSLMPLVFQLPGSDHRYELRGRVRSCRADASSVICGISFEGRESEHFASQQKRISQYVLERQRLALRKRR